MTSEAIYISFIISLAAGLVLELFFRIVKNTSPLKIVYFYLLRLFFFGNATLSHRKIASKPEVRAYLRDLRDKTYHKNETWSIGKKKSFIDMAADADNPPGSSASIADRWRNKWSELQNINPRIIEPGTKTIGQGNITDATMSTAYQTKRIRSISKELIMSGEPIVLLGQPGSGKSTVLRNLAARLSKNAMLIPQAPIPVFVELGKLRLQHNEDPEHAVIRMIRETVPKGVISVRDRIRDDQIDIPLVVLFDGMDEIPRNSNYQKLVNALSDFAREYRHLIKCVFACRTNDFDQNFGHRKFILQPFDFQRVKRYFRKTLGKKIDIDGKTLSPSVVAERLLARHEFGTDSANPLFIYLIANYIDKKSAWPGKRISLYENHLLTLATIALEKLQMPAVEEDPETVIDYWAEMSYEFFSTDASVFYAKKELEKKIDPDVVAVALAGGLLTQEDDILKFQHHRLQEYLVGKRLLADPQAGPDWDKVFESPRWQETLLNFFSIGGDQEDINRFILSRITPMTSYINRFVKLKERAEKLHDQAKARVDSIKPDTYEGAGRAIYQSYSDEQRKKKQAAEKRMEIAKSKMNWFGKFPLAKGMNWADLIIFVCRLGAILDQDSDFLKRLRFETSAVMPFLLQHGRPTLQVRLIKAWQEVPSWFDEKVLNPVRNSSSVWVRTHMIQAALAVPVTKNNVDYNFRKVLEYETIKLRLPAHLRIFKEVSSLNWKRKLQLTLAYYCHLIVVLVVLLLITATGYILIRETGYFTLESETLTNILKSTVWIGLIYFVYILLTPSSSMSAPEKLLLINSVAGGILLCIGKYYQQKSGFVADDYFLKLALDRPYIWLIIPGLVSYLAAFSTICLLILTTNIGRSSISSVFKKIAESPLYFPMLTSVMISLPVLFIASFGGVLEKILGFIAIFIGGLLVVSVAIAILYIVYYSFKFIISWISDRYQKYDQYSPVKRIIRVSLDLFTRLLTIVLILGPICLFYYIILSAENPVDPDPAPWFKNLTTYIFYIVIGILAIPVILIIYVTLQAAFKYILYAVRYVSKKDQLNESDQVPVAKSIKEYEQSFRKGDVFHRRKLLLAFDHTEFSEELAVILRTLESIEPLAENESLINELFYQKLYAVQESIRQQKWTNPA